MLQTKEEIEIWLNQMEIIDYTINDDLTVDVDGNVDLKVKGLHEIPIQFGIVNGNFSLWNNKLMSLKGCPTIVNGYFDCCNNKLKSLQYCPKEISDIFVYHGNQIENFEYFPNLVKTFSAYDSDIKTLKGLKIQVTDQFVHECTSKENVIPEFEAFYKNHPGSQYQYRLQLSPQQLNAIQTEEQLRLEMANNNKIEKKVKI